MKKLVCICFAALLALTAPLCAHGVTNQPKASPSLVEISFKNAVIEEDFSPEKHDYTLTLSDSKVTPTLRDYKIEGDADIFVTYDYDNTKHQTGVLITLEYKNGTTIYNFAYKNAEFFAQNANNYLKEASCKLGVIEPEISRDRTDYTIYIPQDLTVLDMSAATEDVGAYCEVPTEISLTSEQELDIPLSVTASNGEKRVYSFKVRRTKKSSDEFEKMIKNNAADELIESEKFYTNPIFIITVLSAAGAILLILLLVRIAKRLTIELSDSDEPEFFAEKAE